MARPILAETLRGWRLAAEATLNGVSHDGKPLEASPRVLAEVVLSLIDEIERLSAVTWRRLGSNLGSLVLSVTARGPHGNNADAHQLAEGLACASAELERTNERADRYEALLRRVRCYAVVDPLGNPAAIALPNAARMLGIERDIDDALPDERATRKFHIPSGTINARDYGAGLGGPDADDADAIHAATKRAQLEGGGTVSLPPGPLDLRGKPFIALPQSVAITGATPKPYAAGDRVAFSDGTRTVESVTDEPVIDSRWIAAILRACDQADEDECRIVSNPIRALLGTPER